MRAALVFTCLVLGCGNGSADRAPPPSPAVVAAETPPPAAPPAEGEPTDLEHYEGALYAVDGSSIRRASIEAPAEATAIVDLSGSLRIARLAVSASGIAFLGQVVEDGQFLRRMRLMVAAHDGSGLREVWSGDADAYDIALHRGDVVWTQMTMDPRLGVLDESSGALMRAPFAGGAASLVVPIDHPNRLVVLGDDAFVGARGAVVRVPLGAPGPVESVPVTHPIEALAVDATDIASSDLRTGEILITPRAGGPSRSLVRERCARDLALEGASVYFACGDLFRVARSGGPATPLTHAASGSHNALALVGPQVWGYSALEHRFDSTPR